MNLQAEAEPKRDPGLFLIIAQVRKPEDLWPWRARIAPLWRRPPENRSSRPGLIRSSRIFAISSPARSVRPTTWPTLSPRPWRSRAGPSPSMSFTKLTTVLTPADLKRVAARYFQKSNETMITLETEAKK